MNTRLKKSLYESIMKNVAKLVKKALNESIGSDMNNRFENIHVTELPNNMVKIVLQWNDNNPFNFNDFICGQYADYFEGILEEYNIEDGEYIESEHNDVEDMWEWGIIIPADEITEDMLESFVDCDMEITDFIESGNYWDEDSEDSEEEYDDDDDY